MNNSGLFAVFDGHGGQKAAEYCRDHLVKRINEM